MERISFEQAITIIKQNVSPLNHSIQLPLMECLGKILASSITAPISIPPFNRSPYDGYGVIAEDIFSASQKNPVSLSVIDSFMAGDDSSYCKVQSGEAVRIMTGAMIPHGVDCIVPQEQTNQGKTMVSVYQSFASGRNICYKGEDIKKDSIVLKAGTKLNASAIGILASLGYETVFVLSDPSVALISTGSELISSGENFLSGKIFDSNLPFLEARLREFGITPSIFTVKDDAVQLKHILYETSSIYDLVITTGGVSVGEKDFLPITLQQLSASILFHGISIKPGSPAMFSILNHHPILCLAGTPSAAAITFELLARPLLERLTSDSSFLLRKVKSTLISSYSKKSEVQRFVRGFYNKETNTISIPNGFTASFNTNCLIDIPKGSLALLPNTVVNAFLL